MERELQLDYQFDKILYRKSGDFDGYLEMLFQKDEQTGVFFDGIEVFSKDQVNEFDYEEFEDITDIIQNSTSSLFHLSKVIEDCMGDFTFYIVGYGIIDVKSVLDFNEEITQRILFVPFEQ